MARHGGTRAGRWPVQVRYDCGLTGEEYVTQQAWRHASLTRCPLHPKGGCGFARHGTYERLSPPGTLIARWYCPRGHRDCPLNSLRFREENLDRNLAPVEHVIDLAAARQLTPAQVALGQVLSRAIDIAVIPRTRRPQHLWEIVEALQVTFSDDEFETIDRLYPAGLAEGARYWRLRMTASQVRRYWQSSRIGGTVSYGGA